jgi:cytochrome bd-type quinol oxidase subunit 1
MKLKFNRTQRLAGKAFVISLAVMAVLRIIIECLLYTNWSSRTEDTIYSICYLIMLATILFSFLSFLILAAQLIKYLERKMNKSR